MGIGWSINYNDITELIINLIKKFDLPKSKTRGTLKEFTDLVYDNLNKNIDQLTSDILQEFGFEENELLECLIDSYNTKLEYISITYDHYIIGKELPIKNITPNDFLDKLSKLCHELEDDPIHKFMIQYTGRESRMICQTF